MSDDPSIKARAYHEAAHAVIAIHHGLAVIETSIVPDSNGRGSIRIKGPHPWTITKRWRKHACERRYQVLIAGAEGVRLFSDCAPLGDADDKHAADFCLNELANTEAERKEIAERLTNETRSLIQKYRPALDAVAAELVKRRSLTGERVRELARKAMHRATSR